MTPWDRDIVAGLLLTGVWLELAPEEAAMESTGRLSRVRSLSNTGQGKKLHVTMLLYIYTQDPLKTFVIYQHQGKQRSTNQKQNNQPTVSL